RLEVRGREFACFIDGQPVANGMDGGFTQGRISLGSHSSATRFRDLKVTSPDGAVMMDGIPDVTLLPASTHDTSARALPPEITRVDLLAQVNPNRDTLQGQWTLAEGKLISSGMQSQIQFPYIPNGEYDYRVQFERATAEKSVCMIVSFNGHMLGWHL